MPSAFWTIGRRVLPSWNESPAAHVSQHPDWIDWMLRRPQWTQFRQPLGAKRTVQFSTGDGSRSPQVARFWRSIDTADTNVSHAVATLIACTPSVERMDWTSPAGFGLLNRNPCASVHPSIRMHSSCSVVSTPSAVVAISRLLPSPTTA